MPFLLHRRSHLATPIADLPVGPTAAAPIRLPATVLHREIAAMGFDGTERTVRRVFERVETELCSRLEKCMQA